MTRVYVAGPMTTGDIGQNIETAIDAADVLWGYDFIPFVPHLNAFYSLQCYHTYEEWMEYDFAWLDVCDCLFRVPGESPGADREVTKAQEWGKPVFYDYNAIAEYYSKRPVS